MKRVILLLLCTACMKPFGFESEVQAPVTDEMVRLDGGDFLMGYPDIQPGPYGNAWKVNQQPEHPVTVDTFYMDRTEVTVTAWVSFLNTFAPIVGE